ncbi:lysylphosphatidylglycerol synthase transmembrane domain-containing protein [Palleronia pelagia]|uniref:lysylphosphatidylglycerol synthase transmembrane domain-containing protein n=1 Tax=Palleronia pelagia TaxID=387096 RepID=UPI001F27E035|nr:lysylphosphatidylglycerol synthase transmembrane domain-containing protein [Palleronia pelagia]
MPRLPGWLRRVAQVAVAVLLLGLLWRYAGGGEALDRLWQAQPGWLLAAWIALVTQTVLSALRWRLTAAQLGIGMSRGRALSEYLEAQLLNQSIPGGVLGDARRAVRARDQAGMWAAGQSVVIERLAGQVGLFLCLAVGFAATLVVPGRVDWPGWLAVAIALGLLAAALVPPGLAWLARRNDRARAIWRPVAHALLAPQVLRAQLILSFGTALCNLAGFALAARAVGAGLGPIETLTLVPLILLSMLIPLSISGWGLREGAAAVLFPLAGLSASAGLAASVTFGLLLIASALPGVVVLLLRRPTPA